MRAAPFDRLRAGFEAVPFQNDELQPQIPFGKLRAGFRLGRRCDLAAHEQDSWMRRFVNKISRLATASR